MTKTKTSRWGEYIKEQDLVKGRLYRINGQNSRFGVYAGGGMFIIAREKFGTVFLAEELHIDRKRSEESFGGSAVPLKDLEMSPWEEPFRAPNKDELLDWLTKKADEYDERPAS